MPTIPAFVAGESVDADDHFETLDPSTGEVLARLAACGPDQVDAAVGAARAALPGWRDTPVAERSRLLSAFATRIRTDADELADLESHDTGKPRSQAAVDVEQCAQYFEFAAGAIRVLHGDVIPTGPDTLAYTRREPHGVAGVIIPWNYPLQITGRTVSAAVATGNTVVLKPAEEAPLTPMRLARTALEVGFPPGVFNAVPGIGEVAGAALAAHPGIDHLSFTGSVAVGRLVGTAAAQTFTPLTLELGGKSPNIVFADADLDDAVPTIVGSILQNAGQTCSAGSRLLVARERHDELVDRVRTAFASTRIGPGPDDPDLGPLISADQRDRVAGMVADAARESRLVTGGTVPEGDGLAGGFYWAPTLFADVDPGATVAREEVFGPVLATTAFDDPADAARIANGTDYGLIAAIWTRDVDRAHWLAHQLDVGQVYVNSYGAGGGVAFPFGGVKHSGHGREKGMESLVGYTRTKTVAVRTRPPA
ncbi:aldehyde dehydrogenase family protein [Nitriliruptoria bacterium AS10]|nr:aldehyde dehydrogenase family protein [Salsipaludibacter albus]